MTTQEIFEHLKASFEAEADPQAAEEMAAYMRHNFTFFGVRTPNRRKIYADILRDAKRGKNIDWELLDLAWADPHRELDYFVCDYLKAMQTYLTFDDVPKLLSYAATHQWWDSIDYFDRIFGNIKDERIDQLMLDFSQNENFWIRRIAIDHQLGRKQNTKTELLSEIILNNLGSNEFFINKAIGWSLRDYSKTNPEWVRNFVEKHKEKLAPLSIREASKYL